MADDRMFSFKNKSDRMPKEILMITVKIHILDNGLVQRDPDERMCVKFGTRWMWWVPSGDVLIDIGIPAVSAPSLFPARSISERENTLVVPKL